MTNDVDLISTPFANSGTKNKIPESGATNPQNATMEAGFPTITQTPINNGGIPPERADFNGLGYLTTSHLARLNRGLWYEYDPVFADRIGGYPINSRVMLDNGDIAQSTIPNNTNNPNTNTSGWIIGLPARLVVDDSGSNQQKINDMLHLATIQDLPSSASNGQIAIVYDDLRGGKFFFDSSKSGINNGGTVFNGWVRKYFGSVYLDWFCESDPSANDCSSAMEKALAVTRGVKASGRDFLFTGRVGIPSANQSNYATRQIKIQGDGDTTFHIDCLATGRPTFTSDLGKADPTSEANNFVGLVKFSGINFIGVNTNFEFDLEDANKNLVDVPFDGDRLYNSSATFCNFSYLYAGLRCMQGRGESVEGNNAFSQSFTFSQNNFTHCTYLADANQFLNFRFINNECEKNYAGIRANSKKPLEIPAFSVVSISQNLFEAGGMFVDVLGDVVGGLIWNNYQEYNIFQKVAVELCQILIIGENKGCIIGANSFGGQLDFAGYDTEYVDIKTTGKAYDDSVRTDVTTSKPLLIGNMTTSRKLISDTRGISIANSTPYTLRNGLVQVKDGAGYYNSMSLRSHQENDVSFFRGIFNKPLNYRATAVNGTTVKTLRDSDSSVIVAILDLSRIEGGVAKNKISTITGELNCNIELTRDDLTIGNISAKIHVSIVQTGFGASASDQYNQVRVNSKLNSIIQNYDIPIVSNAPSNLMKKQFVEPDVSAVIEGLGGGRYAVRLTNYLGSGVGTFGAPSDIYCSNTWQASVGCRDVQEQVATAFSFIGYWW